MSGHSKWSTIKRKKGALDQKRGKIFTQLAKQVTLAAQNGTDPEMNTPLKHAIQRAKSANVPNDTIDRAIKKAAGAKDGQAFEEQVYEAYGPGGSAFVIKTITDNKNRTVSDTKHILSENGGKLAQSGGVTWMFEERGIITASLGEKSEEEVEMLAIEHDALDVEVQDGLAVVSTSVAGFASMEKALKDAGLTIEESKIGYVAKDALEVDEGGAESVTKLSEALEEHDDIDSVFTNVKL